MGCASGADEYLGQRRYAVYDGHFMPFGPVAVRQRAGDAVPAATLWMFLRMALNAIDGMLAREHGQQSRLGAYLNELTDVVSDAALYLPFVILPPFGWASVGAVIFLSSLSEFAGALGVSIGTTGRRYDGPMGKSDRAVVFGVLGLVYGAAGQLPPWAFWIMPTTAVLILINVICRIRGGLTDS
ncbi:CDP-alcohol phosphatidyltransferase family protein [Propionivibrio sp.]|uniref:CDP-alcohol phosphatidyltransferase family protein n=1 Tax=Propionivibrio sp. TaxID=2212460 RepID=UPI0025ED6939|nr:CDP-alcohol phosphatidyltransferase family protein [Propionivibrio sp.]